MRTSARAALIASWLSAFLVSPVVAQPPQQQAPAAIAHVAERETKIPITLNEQMRRDVVTLSLFVSADEGKSWQREVTVPSNAEHFVFRAPADGAYWFSVTYTDRQGRSVP